jgi:hypothetical protein
MTEERKLFDELMDGIDAMQRQRYGKITLCSKEVWRLCRSRHSRHSNPISTMAA